MGKTVALQNSATPLAALLQDRGYKVIDLHTAGRPHPHVDAVLYNAHYPETVWFLPVSPDTADINLGSAASSCAQHLPTAIMLNVAGMNPEQAAELLEHRLHQAHRHRSD